MKLLSHLLLVPVGRSAAEAAEQRFELARTPHGLTVKLDGELFTNYVVDQANKPYFFPVIGPTGVGMTRAYPMKMVEGERRDHPHHRGINFSHHELNGSNFWLERLSFADRLKGKSAAEQEQILSPLGRTIHREFKSLRTETDHAVVVVSNDYVDSKGGKVLADERTYTFRAPGEDRRIIDVDITLIAAYGTATLHDEKDAGLSIRVPAPMAVEAKQGGRLADSEGRTDGDCWGKRAKWCDYSGPVGGETVGVAFMNHPDSFRFPTPWHARTYGLLTANPFGIKALTGGEDGTVKLAKDERLTLRHRFLFHKGDHRQADVAAAWKAYAAE
jgi:hypothetical protein